MDGLLERDRELAALDRLIADAENGRGRVALIEGPAGIGKSRLLAEARTEAGGRLTVLSARCGELERDFSFGAVRQLLEPVADRERMLAGAAAPAAGVLEAPGGAAEGSFAVLHGLYWAVLNLAEERPVLLALDDLQWSDRPSLRFVAYLVRRLEGSPVLVAATLRSTEPGTDPALIAEIAADPLCEAVRPGPLGKDAVTELVTERLGEPEPRFAAACRDATGGNPLLLRHLIAALAQDGVAPTAAGAPAVREIGHRAVSRTVLLRLSRLPEDAVAVARAVAVLGESSGLPTVAALTGLDEATVARAAGELARADILRAETPLGYVHPLVRDVVYLDVPAGERELQHGRAAEVLAAADAPAEEVAAQLLHAPRRGDPRDRRPAARCRRRGGAARRPRRGHGLPRARARGAAAARAARHPPFRARRRGCRDERPGGGRAPADRLRPRSPSPRRAPPRPSRWRSRCSSQVTPPRAVRSPAAPRPRRRRTPGWRSRAWRCSPSSSATTARR